VAPGALVATQNPLPVKSFSGSFTGVSYTCANHLEETLYIKAKSTNALVCSMAVVMSQHFNAGSGFAVDGTTGAAGGTAGGERDQIASFKIDSSGRYIGAGSSKNAAGGTELALWRYNPDGTLDTSFGTTGEVVFGATGAGGATGGAADVGGRGGSAEALGAGDPPDEQAATRSGIARVARGVMVRRPALLVRRRRASSAAPGPARSRRFRGTGGTYPDPSAQRRGRLPPPSYTSATRPAPRRRTRVHFAKTSPRWKIAVPSLRGGRSGPRRALDRRARSPGQPLHAVRKARSVLSGTALDLCGTVRVLSVSSRVP
jgi:hypothetical protein